MSAEDTEARVVHTSQEPPGWNPDAVPVELHAHRKKLRYFHDCIERHRTRLGITIPHLRILEVGCSNGRNLTTPLAACGYSVTGLDIHAESIEYARSRTPYANARFLCQDLADLGSEERFDVVLLSDVLEHVHDPASLCRASMRHLEPGGIVLISIPNGYGPYELELRALRVTRLDRLISVAARSLARLLRRPSSQGRTIGPPYNYDSGHVQFFHLRDFEQLLDRLGLQILDRANGALFGGTLSLLLFAGFPAIASASHSIADVLPARWVTTWYFCCTPRHNQQITK